MQVGDRVKWTSTAGQLFAGTVRYIPDWAPDTLHIDCDPKLCCGDHVVHVAAASRCEPSIEPTLF